MVETINVVRKIRMLFNSLYETHHQIVKIQNLKKNMKK